MFTILVLSIGISSRTETEEEKEKEIKQLFKKLNFFKFFYTN